MSHKMLFAVPVLALLLASCGNLARNAADNTEVTVFPLANAEVAGDLTEDSAAALTTQGLTAQGISSGTLNYSASFDDFDPATIPSIVGNPSGLDVPIAVQGAGFICKTVTPTSDNITVTIKSINLKVTDANNLNGVSESQSGLNIAVPMTRNATTGNYSVSGVPTNLLTLSLTWLKFQSVVSKGATPTPNKMALSLGVSVDSGTGKASYPCLMKLRFASYMPQKARFLNQ